MIFSSTVTVFISIFGQRNRSMFPNIYPDSLWCLIPRCSSVLIISTSSHKARWFPFAFHIWSTIPNFSISPRTTAFRCSSSLTFSGQHISPLYTLPQLQGMEYTQFGVMLNSVDGLTPKKYTQRVDTLMNIVLKSYGLHIFWMISTRSLTLGRHSVLNFRVSSSILLSKFLGFVAMDAVS